MTWLAGGASRPGQAGTRRRLACRARSLTARRAIGETAEADENGVSKVTP
jgi:hypothetical protein